MYGIVDRPVGHLCGGSRFVLRAMRAWTDAVERGACPPGALATWASTRAGGGWPVPPDEGVIRVFTTRPDTLFGATYMVLLDAWSGVAMAPSRVRETLGLVADENTAEEAFAALVAAEARLTAAGLAPLGVADARAG